MAGMARGRMRGKHAALVEALTGRFDDHHAELARMLLDQIDALDRQVDLLTTRIEAVIAAIPAAATTTTTTNDHDPGDTATPTTLTAIERLDEIPGTRQRTGRTGKGNPYLKGILGEAATAAAKTNTFLGERYRRIVKRRGKLKSLVAIARSILTIVWHLLADPTRRFHELGPDPHTTRIDKGRKIRHLIHQLEALGQTVTLVPTA
jgi:transposase